jgi:succinyl-diaminopimelate desuccinylase
MTDLLALTAELVAVPSVSWKEQALADRIEAELSPVDGLAVDRLGDNVVARTQLGRDSRVLLAGHIDTVPPNGNDQAKLDGDRLVGLGAADMKSGLAVMLDLARTVREPSVDVSYVFYAREEVAFEHSGLRELADARPDLLEGDVALLGEPTDGAVEAGCQGTMRVRIVLRGARAHTARPWMGRNAVHRAAALLQVLHDYEERRPVLDGCEYREALQAVGIEGGVAGNVVPDEVEVLVNHRFAPDRSPSEAAAHVRELVDHVLDPDDTFEVVDFAAGAAPGLTHPLLRTLIERNGLRVRAKLGWTDVAFFAGRGTPAANFGPGDSEVAHTAGEWVTREQIERVHLALGDLLGRPAGRT